MNVRFSLEQELPMRRMRVRSTLALLQIPAFALYLTTVAALAQVSDGSAVDIPIATLHEGSGGTIENRQIVAEWIITNGHLGSLSIRDKTPSASAESNRIQLDIPFSISLKEIGVLHAAELEIQGEARVIQLNPDPGAARYSERQPGASVHYQLTDSAGRFHADWELILRQGSNYIRQRLTVTAADKPVSIDDVRMVDLQDRFAEVAGSVKGSPIVVGNFYLGLESPLSESSVVRGHAVCELQSGVPVGAGQTAQYSSVIGIAPPDQMRRAFLAYVERERAHPYRTFLHYNSWFDIGFFTPYTQQDALDRIHEIGDALHKKRGVVLDSYLFDDGWDNHGDLWKIREDFRDGFTPLTQAAAEYDTAPGVWLSPWGGYGPPKQERVGAAKKAGYEIVDGGLALSGPKYYARFHDAVTEMVTRYGVNQFKLDGTGNADQVVKGSAFSSDFDAAIHLIEDLRKLKPDLYINLTTGTYPSPFWLFYADSIWRGGDDTEFAGVGSSRERWITYRDADTYDEIVKAGRLFPLNSLMLHGIVYAQKAPHLSTDPGGDFRNEVRSYFGSGTQLQELYITPSLLTEYNWDDLAEAAKWSRLNADTLKDTHWIGGDPRWLSVYGWAAWSRQKGILTLRNPSEKPQDFTVDIGRAFELPATGAQRYSAHSPWREDSTQSFIDLHSGQPFTFHLAPFQVLTLEALPQ
jgi:hypothetical protein